MDFGQVTPAGGKTSPDKVSHAVEIGQSDAHDIHLRMNSHRK